MEDLNLPEPRPDEAEACRELHYLINVGGASRHCSEAEAIRRKFPNIFFSKTSKPQQTKIREARLSWLRENPGCTVEEATKAWDLTPARAHEVLSLFKKQRLVWSYYGGEDEQGRPIIKFEMIEDHNEDED